MKAAKTRALNAKHAGTRKHAGTGKHSPSAQKKTAAAHKQAARRAALSPKAAKARALGDVASCVAEAVAASARLAGWPVPDADVLALYRHTADSPNAGASVWRTLEAALAFGLAGVRPVGFELRGKVALDDHLAKDAQFPGGGCVLCQLADEPEQEPVPWPEPFAGADAQVPPLGVLAPFFEFPARDGQEHGGAEFAAATARVAGVADLDIDAIGGEVADHWRCGEFDQGHLSHVPSVTGTFGQFNHASRRASERLSSSSVILGHPRSPSSAVARSVQEIRGVRCPTVTAPGVSLILGLDLPEGPHAVTLDPSGAVWSWGALHEMTGEAVIEEAWAVTWP